LLGRCFASVASEFLSSIFNIFSVLPQEQGLSGYNLREPAQNSGEPKVGDGRGGEKVESGKLKNEKWGEEGAKIMKDEL
jgi:hypothetical protein